VNRKNDWKLLLINNTHPVPEQYTFNIKKLPCGKPVDERIYDSLTKMLADGEASGLRLEVRTAYRTIEQQASLFEKVMNIYMEKNHLSRNEAFDAVKTIIAIPGRSEHNAGLAADIVTIGHPDLLDNSFTQTQEGKWLHANCLSYGFILRYPSDKVKITHISYESWHFRYVGKEAAKEIMNRKICLEEYLGILD
jgi:D-alanyl-D-alanine carboxypeptidase